jgi:CheY-like chemotaxis protein
MRSATDKASKLTSQLLAFARQAPLKLERVDAAEAVREVVSLIGRSLPIEIRVDQLLSEGLWPLQVDTAHFGAALLNLAMNARDAMPEGGTLRFTAENVTLSGTPNLLSGEFVAITVEDTGVGIPQEVLVRIFEPFFTTKPLGKGTGLGLSLVHGFAEQAGGSVVVSSRVGMGTRFTLYLPRAEPNSTKGMAERSARLSLHGSNSGTLRVLVVDDDPAVGRLTVGMLEGAGHAAVSTINSMSALALLEGGQPCDLLLSDVVMPSGMNGIELGREARRRWPTLPILLATGFAVERVALGSEFLVLHKPFTAIELNQAMARVLAAERNMRGLSA